MEYYHQFSHILLVVDTMLHDSPDLVIHRTWDLGCLEAPQVRRNEVWRFLTQQFNCCTCAARCAGALSCWNTKSLPDTLCIAGSSMMLLWRHEAVSKKSVRDTGSHHLWVGSTSLDPRPTLLLTRWLAVIFRHAHAWLLSQPQSVTDLWPVPNYIA